MRGSGAGVGHTWSVLSLRAVVYPHCDRVGLSAGSLCLLMATGKSQA